MKHDDEIFEFPCEFPVKAVGKDNGAFPELVVELVSQHVDVIAEGAIRTNASGKGNYLSVTVTITAHSREQLDAIYISLSDHPDVLMAL